jgi:transposase
MYIETVPNRSSPPAVLLRESFRVGQKVRKRTLANLSRLPPATIEALRRALRGEAGADPKTDLLITSSLPHGHVQAVLETIGRIGLDKVIASHRSRQRDLVLAMIAARLLFPASKLGTTTRWKQCTLAQELRVADADEMELYQALDWLLSRQERIEKQLAGRHLRCGGNVLYDLSSSFYYGTHCPLAKFGHERDKKGLPIITYGVLASAVGCPVGVQVYEGNSADPRTVADQAQKLKERFALEDVVLVGDRGCITQSQIQTLKTYPGLGWIGALKSPAIRKLLDEKVIQPSLFDQQNLAEISSEDFPGERLVACFNPFLAEQRREKREALLGATDKELRKIARAVARRTKTPLSEKEIALKVGRVSNKYKVAKHFDITIGQGTFSYCRKDDEIEREQQLDGIYVIRTSEPAERLSPADAVRHYKDLGQVERAFRCLKGMDLMVRPIYLRTEKHVRAHILLCMLAYYVEWHMRRALAELLYQDEELEAQRQTRDPVLPAQGSASLRAKKATHRNAQGQEVRSWRSLLQALGTLCRNTCRMKSDASESQFVVHTQPNDLQRRAFDLLACTQYGAASN